MLVCRELVRERRLSGDAICLVDTEGWWRLECDGKSVGVEKVGWKRL